MNNQVWVVDDERSIRWVLEKALTQDGLSVTCFEDGDTMLSELCLLYTSPSPRDRG